MSKSDITILLDAVERRRKQLKMSVAQLARDLGYSKRTNDSGYLQVYNWLKVRRYEPKYKAAKAFEKWLYTKEHKKGTKK